MATLRTAGPSLPTIFRFATSQTPTTATRRCAHCLRAQRCPFSSFRPRLQSSKRPLMTESVAHRPQTLDPADLPPPPRNAGVPDTSITTGSGDGSTELKWPPSAPWERKSAVSGTKTGSGQISEREAQAQESRPTAAAQSPSTSTQTTAAPTPSPAKPKKSKLRPRKAPITLTPGAVEHLAALLNQPEGKYVRVGVKNRGCSGLAYHLEYVDKPGSFDESVEQDGVKVLIDSKALFSIIGSEMDWQEDKLSARFVFRNPNITEQCGCGESFSIS